MLASSWALDWMREEAAFTSESLSVPRPGDIDEDAASAVNRAFLEQWRRHGSLSCFDGAILTGADCGSITACPMPAIVVFTSAKSRLMMPGMVMMSEMPCTPWRSTSSAMRKDSKKPASLARRAAFRWE